MTIYAIFFTINIKLFKINSSGNAYFHKSRYIQENTLHMKYKDGFSCLYIYINNA